MPDKHDAAVDRLYGLPLEDFVGERNALAKRLRADGRRDEAAAVAKLPKPSVAAWAANQSLRSQPAAARELFAAGKALEKAQEQLLRKRGDAAALRDASSRQRAVVAKLVAAARGLLDSNGREPSSATLERVQQTLTAASLDPALREDAAGARLTTDHSYAGFGPLGAAAEAPARPKKRKPTAAAERRRAERVKTAERAAAAATKATRAAARRRDAAAKPVAAARAKLEEAEATLAAAEDALAAAEATGSTATAELDSARRAG